jgi:hypothetical protein
MLLCTSTLSAWDAGVVGVHAMHASATDKIITRLKPIIRTSFCSAATLTKFDDLGYPLGPFQVYYASGFAARTESPEHKYDRQPHALF